jgi:F-type H+-transporting ATPase subunit b
MLDISIGLLLFTAVVFFALVYFLNKNLYDPLLSYMKKRDDSIKNDLLNASGNESEIEESLNKANENISQAKDEAAKIKEEAVTKAREEAAQEVAKVQNKLEEEYANFQKELVGKKETLKNDLVANVSSYQGSLQTKLKNI